MKLNMTPSWRQVFGECLTAYAVHGGESDEGKQAVELMNEIADALEVGAMPAMPSPKKFFPIVRANAFCS